MRVKITARGGNRSQRKTKKDCFMYNSVTLWGSSLCFCVCAHLHSCISLVFEFIEVCPVRTCSCICMWAELCVRTTSNDYDFVTAAKGAAEHKISLCIPCSSFIEISRVYERAPVCDSRSAVTKMKGKGVRKKRRCMLLNKHLMWQSRSCLIISDC